MSWWQWLLISVGLLVAVHGAFLGWLVVRGRRGDARALLTLIPDCVILVSRLARDPRVTSRRKSSCSRSSATWHCHSTSFPTSSQSQDSSTTRSSSRSSCAGSSGPAVRS
jgi:hypothetical protein